MSGISRTIKWGPGLRLTKGDLLEFVGNIRSAPDDLVITVHKAPSGGSITDHGGEITLTAELPREPRTIQKD